MNYILVIIFNTECVNILQYPLLNGTSHEDIIVVQLDVTQKHCLLSLSTLNYTLKLNYILGKFPFIHLDI